MRGLRAGAPVEFRGMRIGSVTDVALEVDLEQEAVRIPVTIDIEPQRITIVHDGQQPAEPYTMMAGLVERGLRAQLKSGNLITGELLVDLDFHPDSPAATLDTSGPYPRIPSVPTQLEVLTASITGAPEPARGAAAARPDRRRATHGAERRGSGGIARHRAGGHRPDRRRPPDCRRWSARSSSRMDPLLSQAQATLASTEALLGNDSQLRYDAIDLMRELTSAARSIRLFADYLERHPEALLRGKTGLQ